MKTYYVYIMTNKSKTLYVGMTGNLEQRVQDHKEKVIPGFTQKYNVSKPVYYEETNDVHVGINREKEIKGWRRANKIIMIESANPEWKDLSLDWYD